MQRRRTRPSVREARALTPQRHPAGVRSLPRCGECSRKESPSEIAALPALLDVLRKMDRPESATNVPEAGDGIVARAVGKVDSGKRCF